MEPREWRPSYMWGWWDNAIVHVVERRGLVASISRRRLCSPMTSSSEGRGRRTPAVAYGVVGAILPRQEWRLEALTCLGVQVVRVLVFGPIVVHMLRGVIWCVHAAASGVRKRGYDGPLVVDTHAWWNDRLGHGHVHRWSGERVPCGGDCAVHGHPRDNWVDAGLHLGLRKNGVLGSCVGRHGVVWIYRRKVE